MVPYDAVIFCTGTPYAAPIRQDINDISVTKPTMASRLEEIENYNKRLVNSSHVIVSGGGLVGVELAAELSVRLAGTISEITLISRSTLLSTLPAPAGKYAVQWLRGRKNVKLLLNDEIIGGDGDKVYHTKSGKQLHADMCIDCTGSRAVHKASRLPDQLLSPFNSRGLINVDECLRATDHPSAGAVFAAGDVVEHATGQGVGFACTLPRAPYGSLTALPAVRSAHLAESQAEICAHNVAALLTASTRHGAPPRLHRYPQNMFWSPLCPLISCVSLGPRCGIVVFNDLVLGGFMFWGLGGLLKWVIEKSKVAEGRNRPWARLFWGANHVIVNIIHSAYVSVRALIT